MNRFHPFSSPSASTAVLCFHATRTSLLHGHVGLASTAQMCSTSRTGNVTPTWQVVARLRNGTPSPGHCRFYICPLAGTQMPRSIFSAGTRCLEVRCKRRALTRVHCSKQPRRQRRSFLPSLPSCCLPARQWEGKCTAQRSLNLNSWARMRAFYLLRIVL